MKNRPEIALQYNDYDPNPLTPRYNAYLLVSVIPPALMETQAEERRKLWLSRDLGILSENITRRGPWHENEVKRAAFADPPSPLSFSGFAFV